MIWGQSMWLSSQQVRAMPDELVKRSILMNIEVAENKARELGIEEPQVTTMFISEFYYVSEEER